MVYKFMTQNPYTHRTKSKAKEQRFYCCSSSQSQHVQCFISAKSTCKRNTIPMHARADASVQLYLPINTRLMRGMQDIQTDTKNWNKYITFDPRLSLVKEKKIYIYTHTHTHTHHF